jgi:hypothetical protein
MGIQVTLLPYHNSTAKKTDTATSGIETITEKIMSKDILG